VGWSHSSFVIRHPSFIEALAHLQIGSLAHCIRHSPFVIRNPSLAHWPIYKLAHWHIAFAIRHSQSVIGPFAHWLIALGTNLDPYISH